MNPQFPKGRAPTTGGAAPSKKKSKPKADGIEFDSLDEVMFYRWLKDARALRLVEKVRIHEPADKWVLSNDLIAETVAGDRRKILHPHTYSPDFIVHFSELGMRTIVADAWPKVLLCPGMLTRSGGLLIDVKPSFSPYGNDTERLFSVNRKWLAQRYNLLVVRAVMERLAARTFRPSRTPSGRVSTKWPDRPTASEYLRAHPNAQPDLFNGDPLAF